MGIGSVACIVRSDTQESNGPAFRGMVVYLLTTTICLPTGGWARPSSNPVCLHAGASPRVSQPLGFEGQEGICSACAELLFLGMCCCLLAGVEANGYCGEVLGTKIPS